MLGGALLLGSLFKIDQNLQLKYSLLAGLGISILMVTRPLEGACLTVLVFGVLVVRQILNAESHWTRFVGRVMVPAAAIVLPAIIVLGVYNQSITGSGMKMPYTIHEDAYGWNPLFIWQDTKRKPEYRHVAMQAFHGEDVLKTAEEYATFGSTLDKFYQVTMKVEYFFLGLSLVYGLFGVPWLLKEKKYWLPLATLAIIFPTVYLTPWGNAHYIAPIACLIFLIVFSGMIKIWATVPDPSRKALLWMVLVMHTVWFGKSASDLWCDFPNNWAQRRASIERTLKSEPQKDLVFVRYDRNHDGNQEWVYNHANIDQSEVVWAREISPEKDKALMEYFSDRKVWLVEPDRSRVQIVQHSMRILDARTQP